MALCKHIGGVHVHGNDVCLHADKAVQMNNHTGHVHGYMQPKSDFILTFNRNGHYKDKFQNRGNVSDSPTSCNHIPVGSCRIGTI